jgi:hypothetical protein
MTNSHNNTNSYTTENNYCNSIIKTEKTTEIAKTIAT